MKRISIAIVSFLIAAGLASSPAHGAKQCKGIAKSACANSLDCSWVKGYARKDEIKVKGHCRANKGAAKLNKKQTKAKKSAAKSRP